MSRYTQPIHEWLWLLKCNRNRIFPPNVWHLFKHHCVLIFKTYSCFGLHYSQNIFHSRTTRKKNCSQKTMSQECQRSCDSILGGNRRKQLACVGKAGRGYIIYLEYGVRDTQHVTTSQHRGRGWHWTILPSLPALPTVQTELSRGLPAFQGTLEKTGTQFQIIFSYKA